MKKRNGNSPTENVSTALRESLLKRLDTYCSVKDLNRSQVISRAVKRFLAAEMAEDPVFWDEIYDKYGEKGKL